MREELVCAAIAVHRRVWSVKQVGVDILALVIHHEVDRPRRQVADHCGYEPSIIASETVIVPNLRNDICVSISRTSYIPNPRIRLRGGPHLEPGLDYI